MVVGTGTVGTGIPGGCIGSAAGIGINTGETGRFGGGTLRFGENSLSSTCGENRAFHAAMTAAAAADAADTDGFGGADDVVGAHDVGGTDDLGGVDAGGGVAEPPAA